MAGGAARRTARTAGRRPGGVAGRPRPAGRGRDEIARAREVLALARRGLPAVRVDATYRFDGPRSTTDLLDLFAGRRQLVVVHLMYPAGAGGLCAGCTVIADGIAGLGHLRSRDMELVAVSLGPPDLLAGARARRGWTFPWYSCPEAFAVDFGFLAGGRERPGVAVFLREGPDVLHTYAAHGRGSSRS